MRLADVTTPARGAHVVLEELIALRFPAAFSLATLLALVTANIAKLAIDLGRSEFALDMLGLAGAITF